ncbi:hypothetical protein BDW75DRAFT_244167 [Aspergillus navahoensis]
MESGNDVPGRRYHVKNTAVKGWEYQGVGLPDIQTTTTLLALILIAKVENEERLNVIIRSIPVVQHTPDWRCRTWLINALTALAKDGTAVGTSELDWGKLQQSQDNTSAENTSADRYQNAANFAGPRPTWGMLANKRSCHRVGNF